MAAASGKPVKISTVEKTDRDWQQYKREAKIEEELAQYTKDGSVEGLRVCVCVRERERERDETRERERERDEDGKRRREREDEEG